MRANPKYWHFVCLLQLNVLDALKRLAVHVWAAHTKKAKLPPTFLCWNCTEKAGQTRRCKVMVRKKSSYMVFKIHMVFSFARQDFTAFFNKVPKYWPFILCPTQHQAPPITIIFSQRYKKWFAFGHPITGYIIQSSKIRITCGSFRRKESFLSSIQSYVH